MVAQSHNCNFPKININNFIILYKYIISFKVRAGNRRVKYVSVCSLKLITECLEPRLDAFEDLFIDGCVDLCSNDTFLTSGRENSALKLNIYKL